MDKKELTAEILEILNGLDQTDIENIIENAKILCKKSIIITDTTLRGVSNE